MNENENIGDKEAVGVEVVKKLEKKEDMKTRRRSRGWTCHSTMQKTKGSYPRQLKPIQRWSMISFK